MNSSTETMCYPSLGLRVKTCLSYNSALASVKGFVLIDMPEMRMAVFTCKGHLSRAIPYISSTGVVLSQLLLC